MRLVLPAARAELLQLDTIRSGLPVFRRGIVLFLALRALHRNHFARHENSQNLSLVVRPWPLVLVGVATDQRLTTKDRILRALRSG